LHKSICAQAHMKSRASAGHPHKRKIKMQSLDRVSGA
jgi:hypothetical protein